VIIKHRQVSSIFAVKKLFFMKEVFRNVAMLTGYSFILGATVCIYFSFLGIAQPERIRHLNQVLGLQLIILSVVLVLGILAVFSWIISYQRLRSAYQEQLIWGIKTREEEAQERVLENQQENTHHLDLGVVEKVADLHYDSLSLKLEKMLSAACQVVEASQGAFYLLKQTDGFKVLEFEAGYAFFQPESRRISYELGEGLVGQAAKEERLVNIAQVPAGYITVLSGLGKATPAHLLIVPVKQDNQLRGMLEIAAFHQFSRSDEAFMEQVAKLMAEQIPVTEMFA
jgi:putative methionine-R-sulfoxide reductase with GAF domain